MKIKKKPKKLINIKQKKKWEQKKDSKEKIKMLKIWQLKRKKNILDYKMLKWKEEKDRGKKKKNLNRNKHIDDT